MDQGLQTEALALSGHGDFPTLFTHGAAQDRIDLSAIDANTRRVANQAFTGIGAANFGGTGAASADQPLVQGRGGPNARIVEVDANGDGFGNLQLFVRPQTTLPLGGRTLTRRPCKPVGSGKD
jgi:hypothetical protein